METKTIETPENAAGEATCTLAADNLAERRRYLLEQLLPQAIERRPLANGYVLNFQRSDPLRAQLDAFILLEARCCSFLEIELHEISNDILQLQITGPPEMGAFVDRFLSGAMPEGTS